MRTIRNASAAVVFALALTLMGATSKAEDLCAGWGGPFSYGYHVWDCSWSWYGQGFACSWFEGECDDLCRGWYGGWHADVSYCYEQEVQNSSDQWYITDALCYCAD